MTVFLRYNASGGDAWRERDPPVNRWSCLTETNMEYLIDCTCGHDLTRHDESGCRANDSSCICERTKLEALDSAIDQARVNPWGRFLRAPAMDGSDETAASA
jgi:hypothetical protein